MDRPVQQGQPNPEPLRKSEHHLPRILPTLVASLVSLCLCSPPNAYSEEITPEQGDAIFSKIDSMLADVREIMDFGARRPIKRSLISKQQISDLVSERLEEETKPDEIRREEIFLKLFGLVDEDFDLKKALVDIMTEQATALYDYKTRNLYLATWTPKDMQEFALVHELTHAVADQQFGLEKFVKRSKTSDEDLARSAVIEGQASWVMTEWVMQQSGQSLTENRLLAVASASASRIEAKDYPVYSNTPLYIRETLIFPYSDGLLFQQELIERYGKAGFTKIFESPPLSTQHVMQPELYFDGLKPAKPALPAFKAPKGFKKIYEGVFGQFEHEVLLRNHLGEDKEFPVAEKWRGSNYEIYENRRPKDTILRYASIWTDEDAAAEYLQLYRQVCEAKWGEFNITSETPDRIEGTAPNGRFILSRTGSLVQALEGLPDTI